MEKRTKIFEKILIYRNDLKELENEEKMLRGQLNICNDKQRDLRHAIRELDTMYELLGVYGKLFNE